MNTKSRIWIIFASILFFTLVKAEVSLALDLGKYKDLKIKTYSRNKCDAPVNVYIKADQLSYFKGEKIDLQKAVGLTRGALAECANVDRINIFGVADRKVAYRGHIAKQNRWRLTDDFFKDTEAHAPWGSQEGTRSWTTDLIGTWKGQKFNTEMEIAIWVPKTAHGAAPWLKALIRSTDGMCTYESGDSIMGNWNVMHLPKETKDYDAIHLQYSIILYVMGVNGNYSPSNKEHQQCSRGLRGFNFTVLQDKKTGQVFMYNGKSSLYLHPEAPLWPLTRVNASRQMMALIDQYKRSKRKPGPSPAQKILIADKTKRFESYQNKIPISCMVDHQFALAQLRKTGINIIEAFPVEGEKMVEVSSQTISWKKNSEFYPADLNVDWNNLSLGKSFKFVQEDACKHAKATLDYLALAHGKKYQSDPQQQKSSEKIASLDGYYLVDRNGVDLLKIFKKGGRLGRAERAFGSSTVFEPGDKTRDIRWTDLSQILLIKDHIKSVVKGEIVPDRFNDVDERKFVHDRKLSKKLNGIVFSSNASEHGKTFCIEWTGKIHVNNCERYMKKGARKQKLYLTKDRRVATALFKALSPDERTWIGIVDVQDTCPGGPFCELEAGEYLNAIYRADFKGLRTIEDKALEGLNKTLGDLTFGDERMIEFFSLISGRANRTLLPFALNEYMYGYYTRPRHCFKKGALKAEYWERTPDIVYSDVYPMLGTEIELFRTQGQLLYSKYLINPEFKGVCDELCGVHGSNEMRQVIDSLLEKDNALARKIYNSFKAIGRSYDCNSPEVQRFEKNLRDMYKYNKKQLWMQTLQRNTW